MLSRSRSQAPAAKRYGKADRGRGLTDRDRTPSHRPKGTGLGRAAMVPSVDTGGHSEGQGNPAFFTRWPLNQKEERPLAPHLV